MAQFLDHWRPGLALFIESDLWPNLVLSGAARRIPMVIINGRMSQRSFPRWQKLRGTIAALLECFDLCLAQSDRDAERFAALGCANVITSGNLKLDVEAPPADPRQLEQLRLATQRRPVFVAASTHPGEDEIIGGVHRRLARQIPSLLGVIVPRHPDRGAAIAQALTDAGCRVALRSRHELPSAATDIYVADTMGELGLFYRLAPVVFMGGSLVPHGGQNRSRRSSSAPRSCTAARLQLRRSLRRARSGRRRRRGPRCRGAREVARHPAANPIARQRALAAAEQVVDGSAAAGEDARRARALSAAAAAGGRDRRCVSRPSGIGRHRGCRDCWRRSARSTARLRRGGCGARARSRECRWSASATTMSAAPARRRRFSRWRTFCAGWASSPWS